MESVRVQPPFVLLQAVPLAGLTRMAGSGRTAFRGGRQNVAGTGFWLSPCIPLGARGSRISVLFPSRARLRGSRRGCFDVLTKCYLETCCCPLAFGRLRDKRRPAPPKQAREFPRGVFLPTSGLLKYTAVPIGFLLSLVFSEKSGDGYCFPRIKNGELRKKSSPWCRCLCRVFISPAFCRCVSGGGRLQSLWRRTRP